MQMFSIDSKEIIQMQEIFLEMWTLNYTTKNNA